MPYFQSLPLGGKVLSASEADEGRSLFPFIFFLLFIRFSSVMLAAKHLAIFRAGFAALAPRRNVIRFHFFDFVMRFFPAFRRAHRADPPLPLVCLPLLVFRKRAYIQILFVPDLFVTSSSCISTAIFLSSSCGLYDFSPYVLYNKPHASPFISLRYFGKIVCTHAITH